jgi:hypothetical protein
VALSASLPRTFAFFSLHKNKKKRRRRRRRRRRRKEIENKM